MSVADPEEMERGWWVEGEWWGPGFPKNTEQNSN